MKQCVLSIYPPDGDPPPHGLEKVMENVRRRGDTRRGRLGFTGRLHEPSTATVLSPRARRCR
jgi:hypothetical protein